MWNCNPLASCAAIDGCRQWQKVVPTVLVLQVLTMLGYHFWATPPGPPWNPSTEMFGTDFTQELDDSVNFTEEAFYLYMANADDETCDLVFSGASVEFQAPEQTRWQIVGISADCGRPREVSGFRRVGSFEGPGPGRYKVDAPQPLYWLQQSLLEASDAIAARNYLITMLTVFAVPVMLELAWFFLYLPRQQVDMSRDHSGTSSQSSKGSRGNVELLPPVEFREADV